MTRDDPCPMLPRLPARTGRLAWVSTLTGLLALIALSTAPVSARGATSDDEEVVEEIIDDEAPASQASQPAAAGDGDDTVEEIGGGGDDDDDGEEEEQEEESFQASGWARTSFEMGLERAGRHADDPDLLAVPYDQVVARQLFFLRLRYARGESFEAVASGLLSYAVFEQDAPLGETFYGFNGSSSQSYYEHSLQEAYVGFFWRHCDLRLGQQRVAWGRSDAYAVNDVINAVDTRDPALGEGETIHLPVLMARGDCRIGEGRLSAVFVPFLTPSKFDFYGRNWSRIQPDAPPTYLYLFSQAQRMVHVTLRPALNRLLGQTELPPDNLSGAAGGLRYSWTIRGFDFDGYYHYGYDTVPSLEVDPQVLAQLEDFSAILGSLLSAPDVISSRYVRRHHVGASFQTAAGPLVIRSDVAYDSRKVFVRRADLTGANLPAVRAVLGLEYHTGDLGKSVILEGLYHRILDAPPLHTLLGHEQDSGGIATRAQWRFFEHLELELRGALSLHPVGYLIRPQVSWAWPTLALQAGVLLLGGEAGATEHYYRRNQVGYVMAKLRF